MSIEESNEREAQANNVQSKISFNTIISVFLRTFLATFGGAVGAYFLAAAGYFLRVPNSGMAFYTFPILCLASGIWYISYAKKKYGGHWSVGVSGIFGILAVFILLFFVLGTSL
jgi:uncharacterized membrane protein HdeD (DUF308 family)